MFSLHKISENTDKYKKEETHFNYITVNIFLLSYKKGNIIYILFWLFFLNKKMALFYHLNHLSTQFNSIKYVHIFVQPLPLSISKIFIFPNGNTILIKH